MKLNMKQCLPVDYERAVLLGRVWCEGAQAGPSVVLVQGETVYDISASYPLLAELLNEEDLLVAIRQAEKIELGKTSEILENSDGETRDPSRPYFLAPCDLQALKACGVTFASSLLERLVEEQAKGDPMRAKALRQELEQDLGVQFSNVVPGSKEALAVKEKLLQRNLWSQYLEVGIGPDAEVFTKAQPMSAVGTGAYLGVRADSRWNNPEPEVVLAVSKQGEIVGVTLGNDVNLRDFEGRSALLLGKAKDNNGSCVIGPFIRVFDAGFGIEHVRCAELTVEVEGIDGFIMRDTSTMAKISRDVTNLVQQTIGPNNQYPDGLMLFTGTLFSPTHDREGDGKGFTHKQGDVVKIVSERLGALINRVGQCHEIPLWRFGTIELVRNLRKRGLL